MSIIKDFFSFFQIKVEGSQRNKNKSRRRNNEELTSPTREVLGKSMEREASHRGRGGVRGETENRERAGEFDL